MKDIFGIDGCRFGWVVAEEKTKGHLSIQLIESLNYLESVISKKAIAGIDIPLAIHKKGFRMADAEARVLLKSRASTIFSAPAKETLLSDNYNDACAINESICGKKISKQSWFLFSKIKEARTIFSQAHKKIKLYEVHPELSFMAMNDMRVIELGKKTDEGFKMRHKLVKKLFSKFDFEQTRANFKRCDVADDDILDAIAVLWSTQKIVANMASYVPKKPETPLSKIYY
jgi:predicted RNase H-like nuclease